MKVEKLAACELISHTFISLECDLVFVKVPEPHDLGNARKRVIGMVTIIPSFYVFI